MEAARLVDKVPQVTLPTMDKASTFGNQTDPGPSTVMHKTKTNLNGEFEISTDGFFTLITLLKLSNC